MPVPCAILSLILAACLPTLTVQSLTRNCPLGYRNQDIIIVTETSENAQNERFTGGYPLLDSQINLFLDDVQRSSSAIRVGLRTFSRRNGEADVRVISDLSDDYNQVRTSLQAFRRSGSGADLVTALEELNDALPNLQRSAPTLALAIVYVSPISRANRDNVRSLISDIESQDGVSLHFYAVDLAAQAGNVFDANNFYSFSTIPFYETLAQSFSDNLLICNDGDIDAVCAECIFTESTGTVRHPSRCDQFYKCTRDLTTDPPSIKGQLTTCGHNTLFDQDTGTCIHAKDVLASTSNSGCTYCQEAGVDRFPYRDSCEAFYTCSQTAAGQMTLTAQCCPFGQVYEADLGRCVVDSRGCQRGRYVDDSDLSCRHYLDCSRSVEGSMEVQCCVAGTFFNASLGECQASSTCKGGCDDARHETESCNGYQATPSQPCYFQYRENGTPTRCPATLAWSQTDCGCTIPTTTCGAERSAARCDSELLVSHAHNSNWGGFNDESPQSKYITSNVTFNADGHAVYPGNTHMYYGPAANNNYIFNKGIWAQIKFLAAREDGQLSNSRQVLVSNAPCAEAPGLKRSSVFIEVLPSARTVYVGVRTPGGNTTLPLIWTDQLFDDNMATVTLRYDNSILTASLTVDNSADVITESSETPEGTIFKSSCGLKIGKGLNTENPFVGVMSKVEMIWQCNDLPSV